jgi:hypothetical protein
VQQLTVPIADPPLPVVVAIGLGAEIATPPRVTATEAGLSVAWPDGGVSDL